MNLESHEVFLTMKLEPIKIYLMTNLESSYEAHLHRELTQLYHPQTHSKYSNPSPTYS